MVDYAHISTYYHIVGNFRGRKLSLIETSQRETFIISVFLAMYEAMVYNSLLDILFTKYPAIAFHISFYPRVSSAP